MLSAQYDLVAQVKCLACNKLLTNITNSTLQDLVDALLKAPSVNDQANVAQWEDEIIPCEHTLTFEQNYGAKICSKLTSTCSQCNLKENLWLCMTCGNLACGRKNFDGSGGNGHAMQHFEMMGHSLSVKTGTITPDGNASIYCYSCKNEVKDNFLADHLSFLGIDISKQEKTEKTMTEINITLNLNLNLSKVLEEGKVLPPLYGVGYTGINNTGNTCYIASTIQSLMSLESFQARFVDSGYGHLKDCKLNSATCYECLISKLAIGLQSGFFSIKKTRVLPVEENNQQVIEEYQDGINLNYFKRFFAKQHPEFASNKQQDAYEYLLYLLGELDKYEGSLGHSQPSQEFEFEVETKLYCQSCGSVKVRINKQNSLVLSLEYKEEYKNPESTVYLTDLMSNWHSATRVEGVDCPVCQYKTSWIKTQRMMNFPKYLIILFQRNVYEWVPIKLEVGLDLASEHVSLSLLGKENSKLQGKVIESSSYLDSQKKEGNPIESNINLFENENSLEEGDEPELNNDLLQELVMNGVPLPAAKQALYQTGNSTLDAAYDWFYMNLESPSNILT